MEPARKDRERGAASLTRLSLLAATLILLSTLSACSGRAITDEATDGTGRGVRNTWTPGFEIGGQPLPEDVPLTVDTASSALRLVIRLPDGYLAADGFQQQFTITTPDGAVSNVDTDRLDQPVVIPIPATEESTLSFIIGYCAEEAKDICYVDRAVLTIVTGSDSPVESSPTLVYRPGAHL